MLQKLKDISILQLFVSGLGALFVSACVFFAVLLVYFDQVGIFGGGSIDATLSVILTIVGGIAFIVGVASVMVIATVLIGLLLMLIIR